MAFDTTELLASVRQRAMLPENSADGTDDTSILRIATEEIRTRLAPFILRTREEYLVSSSTHALVADKAAYRINPRAIGSKLRRLALLESDGRERPLLLFNPEARGCYPLTGTPVGYYLEAASVVLVPTPDSASLTLKQWFYVLQSQLVLPEAAGLIEIIDLVDNQITIGTALETIPQELTSRYDLVRGGAGFEPLTLSLAPTGFNGPGQYLFAPGSIPSDLVVGDYLCIAEQSLFPYLPADLHPVLYQRVAVKLLEAQGDSEGLANAKRELDEMEKLALPIINPRNDGQTRVVVDNSLLLALE